MTRPLAALALLAAVASARADDPCAADAARLCQGIPPGRGRLAACLASHQADLSPACRQKIEAARRNVEELAEACRPDAARLCQGIVPGRGRIAACLRSHEADLSPACRGAMAAGRQRVRELSDACRPDAARLCRGIPPGGGRILACLKSHEADLSPACRAELSR